MEMGKSEKVEDRENEKNPKIRVLSLSPFGRGGRVKLEIQKSGGREIYSLIFRH